MNLRRKQDFFKKGRREKIQNGEIKWIEVSAEFRLHVVFFIRNVVKMCTVAIFRFCTVVSYFFPGILDSRFLVVYENMQNFVFGQWLNFHYVWN